eukprot:gnl/TRDRNA2_/TRDRNA2_178988_c0_seq1.p1 gnl/TRDRNA2_/TRDRNA2_178988_c0~~gnl/TRDRNA2_/TRDRNA2_178988_c0_seq1.p1  ORF type:complete len:144 (+),score=17.90 gnl/TRDRNA2_/TRDRNA2_178988_c0_seq1:111-542(+)
MVTTLSGANGPVLLMRQLRLRGLAYATVLLASQLSTATAAASLRKSDHRGEGPSPRPAAAASLSQHQAVKVNDIHVERNNDFNSLRDTTADEAWIRRLRRWDRQPINAQTGPEPAKWLPAFPGAKDMTLLAPGESRLDGLMPE